MSRVHLGHSIRRGLAAMTATAWWALGALMLAALVVFLCTIPLVRAIFISSTAKEASSADLKGQYALHDKAMDGYVKQIDGRSLFVIPSPPPRKSEPVTITKHIEEPPPVPKGPTSYGGPAISAIINDTVWFADGKKLALGEPAKEDVAVSAIDAPWSATLAWKGKDFEVPFFERDRVMYPKPGTPPLPPSAPEPAKKPDAPKAGETKPDPTKPDPTKPAEVKPGDTKPADTKPEEPKPGEPKTGDPKPSDSKPGDGKPATPDGPETPKTNDPKVH